MYFTSPCVLGRKQFEFTPRTISLVCFCFPFPFCPCSSCAHMMHTFHIHIRTKDNYVYTTTSTTKNVNSNATDTPYLTSRNQQPEVRNPSQDGTLKGGAVRWMQCSAIPPHTHAWLHALQSSGDRLSFMYAPCHTYNHIHRYWYIPVYTFTCVCI